MPLDEIEKDAVDLLADGLRERFGHQLSGLFLFKRKPVTRVTVFSEI